MIFRNRRFDYLAPCTAPKALPKSFRTIVAGLENAVGKLRHELNAIMM